MRCSHAGCRPNLTITQSALHMLRHRLQAEPSFSTGAVLAAAPQPRAHAGGLIPWHACISPVLAAPSAAFDMHRLSLHWAQEEPGVSAGAKLAADPQLPERLLVAWPRGMAAVSLPWLPLLARNLSAGMHAAPSTLAARPHLCKHHHLLCPSSSWQHMPRGVGTSAPSFIRCCHVHGPRSFG